MKVDGKESSEQQRAQPYEKSEDEDSVTTKVRSYETNWSERTLGKPT